MPKINEHMVLTDKRLLLTAVVQSFAKLNPRSMFRNPVMFTVWISTLIMIGVCIWIGAGDVSQGSLVYNLLITVILFITLLFANFAEAIAEAMTSSEE